MPINSAPQGFIPRFAAALSLVTLSLTGSAYLLIQGASGQPIQVWKDSSGNTVCTIGSGGLLSGNCTTGLGGGTSVNTGAILNAGNSRFVNVSGDSMTGALVISNGNPAVTADPGLLLEVIGSASGRVLYATDSLRSSGSLVWEGSASGASLWTSTFNGSGLTDCDTGATSKLLWDLTTQKFSCGTDQTGGSSVIAGQGLNIAGGAVSLNSSFSGTSLEIMGTISGSSLVTYGEPRIPKTVVIPLCDGATACATGSGVMFVMRGEALKGNYRLSGAYLDTYLAGTTGTMTVQLRNVTDSANVFSTTIQLDTGETSSTTAATPYVIGAGVFTEGDRFVPNITATHTTPAKGTSLILELIPQ